MWLILLDHSGSMGDPFAGTTEFHGRSKRSTHIAKLDAAKAAIIERLLGIGEADIALFGFTSNAIQLFDGSSRRRSEIETALNKLQAHNGTNVAAALDSAREYIEVKSPKIIRVLVITDGLSDADAARRAAEQVSQLGGIIDVILIDPSSKGELLARSINFNGEVTAVTSPERFDAAMEAHARQHDAMAKQAEEFDSAFEAEAASLQARIAQKERLAFSVAYPRSVAHSQWYSILVIAHLEQLREIVLEMLERRAAQIRLRHAIAEHSTSGELERGTVIVLTPQINGINFNPVSYRFMWVEDVHEVCFRMRGQDNIFAGPKTGSIDVHAEIESARVLIGQIALSIHVRDEGDIDESDTLRTESIRIFNRIFASYSTKDSAVVESCVEAYEALGIYVYLDKNSLRDQNGLEFFPIIKDQINRSDLFQLYWSSNSETSHYVDREWRHAHSIRGRKGDRFILPICLEDDWLPLPQELNSLQCKRLTLVKIANKPTIEESDASAILNPKGTRAKIPVTVLPLIPGSAVHVDQSIKSDTQFAVNFCEEMTGLRYYPVPTLLVDDHIAKCVRKITAIDWKCSNPEVFDCVDAAADVLSSIGLEFHTCLGNRGPSHMSRKSIREAFGEGKILNVAQYDRVQGCCEGIIRSFAHQFLIAIAPEIMESEYKKFPKRLGDEPIGTFVARSLRDSVREFSSCGTRPKVALSSDPEVEKRFALLLAADLQATGIRIADSYRTDHVRLSASKSGFLALLEQISGPQSRFAEKLVELDPTAPENPASHLRIVAVANVVAAILRENLDRQAPLYPIANLIDAFAFPSWRICRDTLVEAGISEFDEQMSFLDFLDSYCLTIQSLFENAAMTMGEFVYSAGYGIPKKSWDNFVRKQSDIHIATVQDDKFYPKKDAIMLIDNMRQFASVFGSASKLLLRSISQLRPFATQIHEYFTAKVPMYGIYIGEQSEQAEQVLDSWALTNGIPAELTLPHNSRVLFCLNSIDRFRSAMEQSGQSRRDAMRLARDFQRCVLIHEHFHAILETGLDSSGATARGPRFGNSWNAAVHLNESLAAWMEFHYSRSNQELHEIVRAYIFAGEYPAWPYRGAEKLEIMFQSQGLAAIRAQIAAIRDDPESAQAAFNL